MRKQGMGTWIIKATLSLCMLSKGALLAESSTENSTAQTSEAPPQRSVTIEPFTGKVTRPRVRMRLEPNLNSPIIEELNQGDMVIVTSEDDDFYGVKPPLGAKGFIFRTYVLDGVIEGNHVNVRLEPHLDAPVVVQLNTGDRADGEVSALNSKWLEIDLPDTVRFYVATDFIERVGDSDMMGRMERRRKEATQKVNASYVLYKQELSKPFEEIDLSQAKKEFDEIIASYEDVPEEQERARYFLRMADDAYLRRKIDHLQTKALMASEQWNDRCRELAERMNTHGIEIDTVERDLCERSPEFAKLITPDELEVEEPLPLRSLSRKEVAIADELETGDEKSYSAASTSTELSPPAASKTPPQKDKLTQSMLAWISHEAAAYRTWSLQHPQKSMDDFYHDQNQRSLHVRGRIQPYKRNVRNKPGNFLLLDEDDNLPIAFVYSTKVNLNDQVGKVVSLRVAPRPSNNFAFPAYFVLEQAGSIDGE